MHAQPEPERAAPRPGPWRVVGRVLLIAFLAYVALGLLAMWFEESLIFFPTRFPVGNWEPPGLEFENAHFTAADGTQLHGWFVPHPDPRAYILFAHGNAGNLSDRADMIRMLRRLGLAVMIFDYRGYGRSDGTPNEQGVLQDARAARAWLAQRAGIDESEVILLGRSIGGAIMVDLAAKDGAGGLILENTFTSLPDVAAYHYGYLPVHKFMRNRLDAESIIGNYHGPLLQCHGDADTIIPIELGQRLFAAANEPKAFIVLEGHDHNDFQPKYWYEAVDRFVDRLE